PQSPNNKDLETTPGKGVTGMGAETVTATATAALAPATEAKDEKTTKMTEKDKEDFVADVIKEYLHLSASSVKIKFPLVSAISNEMLIEQTRHLPFYQYHDFMVRIMEKEMKRLEEEKKRKLEETERQRRRSQADSTGKEQPEAGKEEETDDEDDHKTSRGRMKDASSAPGSPLKSFAKSKSSSNISTPNI
ncbi:hypothetical protein RFI_35146, partial [Reticulomyxa filosa]